MTRGTAKVGQPRSITTNITFMVRTGKPFPQKNASRGHKKKRIYEYIRPLSTITIISID